MAFLIKNRKVDLIRLAQELDESSYSSMPKIDLKYLIVNNKHYDEEVAKELLEVITAERLETEQQLKLENENKFKLEQEKLALEKMRLEGDEVSKLLLNLEDGEFNNYESLKKILLQEYEPSPKLYLENFRKAKRNHDETFTQFASRLTSMWLYYRKLRGVNDLNSIDQLIVADKMLQTLYSETAFHIEVLQGKYWYKPKDLGWGVL
ncbi:hypothetical protein AVEN_26002-1 [Araneus ventricosus]|uniref:Retrotransposon gag domain-containing protein n=1 Tax=Araneus ventricosus TaxID=182803 RepID=A0A4Y2E4N3_ARAVE|nr:hypothetical protein AVEN_26002-1 [Araneus ventricosus]